MQLILLILFIIVFVVIVNDITKGKSVMESVIVVDKRVSLDPSGKSHSKNTRYYITFQSVSGKRLELSVEEKFYGIIIKGDQGSITYKEDELIRFDRRNS